MQIIIVLTVLIIAITSILYVVNDKFEKKEFIILLLTIIVSGVTYGLFEKNQSEFFPNLFKEKYEKFIAFAAHGFMRKDFLKVTKDSSLEGTITDILEKDYEFALVFEEKTLVGILTKSDLINSL